MTGDREKNAVAVDDFSRFADEERAVGVAVESHSELSALGKHACLQSIEMERAAAGIDIAAIRGNAHRDNISAEGPKKFGAEFVSGAVGAVEQNAEAGELGSGNDATAQKIEIFGVERSIGNEKGRIFRRRAGAMLENVGFEFFFDGVRELHARVREKLDAIVLVRIVRRGNHDAGLKIILAHEAGHAGRGDDTGKSYGGSGLREASGEKRRDVRTGFAGVHADEHVGRGVLAEQISGERAAGGEKSSVVEGRRAGNAANAVGSEKFFGHERLAANSRGAKHTKSLAHAGKPFGQWGRARCAWVNRGFGERPRGTIAAADWQYETAASDVAASLRDCDTLWE